MPAIHDQILLQTFYAGQDYVVAELQAVVFVVVALLSTDQDTAHHLALFHHFYKRIIGVIA